MLSTASIADPAHTEASSYGSREARVLPHNRNTKYQPPALPGAGCFFYPRFHFVGVVVGGESGSLAEASASTSLETEEGCSLDPRRPSLAMSSGQYKKSGVLIGNWAEDRYGGDVFKPGNSDKSMYQTTQQASYTNPGAAVAVEVLRGKMMPPPTAAHCVNKETLFYHEGGARSHVRAKRELLDRKRAQWREDTKINSRANTKPTTAMKTHFSEFDQLAYERRVACQAQKSEIEIFPKSNIPNPAMYQTETSAQFRLKK